MQVTTLAGRDVESDQSWPPVRDDGRGPQADLAQLLRMTEALSGVGHWRVDVDPPRVQWSDQVYAIHGVRRETFDPNLEEAVGFYHPDDRDAVRVYITRCLQEGVGFEFRLRLNRADGAMRHVISRASAVRGPCGRIEAAIGVFEDVTDFIEAQAATAAREAHFRLLAENSNDLVTHVDAEGRMTYLSPACMRITGYHPDEVLGRTVVEFVHPDDQAMVVAAFTRGIRAGLESWSLEYRLRHRDGHDVWIEARPTRILDAAGRFAGVTDVLRDVTARKQVERELVAARAEAERLAAVKADFLANMSHELRTPLNSILGYCGLLQRRFDLPFEAKRQLDIIARSGDDLRRIVDDVLDVSALESGQVSLDSEPFALAALIEGTLDGLRVLATEKGLSLDAALHPALAPRHLGDAHRLRQVLANLVGNAVKFTRIGGITVNAMAEGIADERQRVTIQVRDTGPGIDAASLPTLFRRFSQADAPPSNPHGGTGLGLAICHGLIERMGGSIRVDSQPDVGTTFTIRLCLPIAAPPGTAEAGQAAPTRSPDRARVLVVDDMAINRDLARLLISELGYVAEAAEGGEDALRRLAAERFDLVLMDVRMPGMDGLEATRRLRADPRLVDLPVIALTAQALPEQVAACRAAGMDAHLAKPLDPRALAQMLATWIAPRAPASPQPPAQDAAEVPPSADFDALARMFADRTREDIAEIEHLRADGVELHRERLGFLVHRLAGCAASFGHPELGACALQIDRALAARRLPDPDAWRTLTTLARAMPP